MPHGLAVIVNDNLLTGPYAHSRKIVAANKVSKHPEVQKLSEVLTVKFKIFQIKNTIEAKGLLMTSVISAQAKCLG